jgi:hypothetical protein
MNVSAADDSVEHDVVVTSGPGVLPFAAVEQGRELEPHLHLSRQLLLHLQPPSGHAGSGRGRPGCGTPDQRGTHADPHAPDGAERRAE